MRLSVTLYAVVHLASCQLSRSQWRFPQQPISSAGNGFTPHSSPWSPSNARVLNALPAFPRNNGVQERVVLHLSTKTSESLGFKKGESLLAGNMSKEFVKNISDYLYGLVTGKYSIRAHRFKTRSFRRKEKSHEVLDYEDEIKTRDMEERAVAQRRSTAVLQSPSRIAGFARFRASRIA